MQGLGTRWRGTGRRHGTQVGSLAGVQPSRECRARGVASVDGTGRAFTAQFRRASTEWNRGRSRAGNWRTRRAGARPGISNSGRWGRSGRSREGRLAIHHSVPTGTGDRGRRARLRKVPRATAQRPDSVSSSVDVARYRGRRAAIGAAAFATGAMGLAACPRREYAAPNQRRGRSARRRASAVAAACAPKRVPHNAIAGSETRAALTVRDLRGVLVRSASIRGARLPRCTRVFSCRKFELQEKRQRCATPAVATCPVRRPSPRAELHRSVGPRDTRWSATGRRETTMVTTSATARFRIAPSSRGTSTTPLPGGALGFAIPAHLHFHRTKMRAGRVVRFQRLPA